MFVYAMILTFLLGCLTTPVAFALYAYRTEQREYAKSIHPSNQDAAPSILNYNQS